MKTTRSFKKTKILATLGPASSDPEIIRQLLHHGMNAVRLNFSHGTHEDHKKNIQTIRQLEVELNTPIPIIQDLQGPKIRVGTLPSPIIVKKHEEITLHYGETQQENDIPVQENIFPYLKIGDPVFINDGIIRLQVKKTEETSAVCIVEEGGEIKTHKGINIPETILPNMSLTEKDKKDLAFGLEEGVDYIAVSFVQKPEDIREVKKLIGNAIHQPGIIAKIETKVAVTHLEEIIHESKAVMVARGDLAVELGQEEVPIIQRDIIAIARKHNTPVIIATQMLESMITNPEPTRAEVNDVATAVLEQTDAVMLSAESAAGKYPKKAVAMMDRIIRRAEMYLSQTKREYELPELEHADDVTSAIDAAAALIVHQLDAKMIFAQSATGLTVFRLAAYRPRAVIVAISSSLSICRQLELTWGVDPFHLNRITDTHNPEYRSLVKKLAHRHQLGMSDTMVLITGKHPGIPGHTNTIHISSAQEYYED
jgi:pyruvate kinase